MRKIPDFTSIDFMPKDKLSVKEASFAQEMDNDPKGETLSYRTSEQIDVKKRYSEKFYRVWNYYLLSMAGGFRARYMQVWQIVLSQLGRNGGYTSIRCPRCSDSSK